MKAVTAMVNVLNRYARLFGLDAPRTIDTTIRGEGLDLSAMSEGQLVEHCQRLGIPVDLLPPTVDTEPPAAEGGTATVSVKAYNRNRMRGYWNARIIHQLLDRERRSGYGRHPLGLENAPLTSSAPTRPLPRPTPSEAFLRKTK